MNNRPIRSLQYFSNVSVFVLAIATLFALSILTPTAVLADGHEAAEEAPAPEKRKTTGWFQLNADSLGNYFLVGASHPLGKVSIDSNIYVNGHFGEFDLGVSVPVIKSDSATLILLPMLGVGFDYTTADGPDAIFPQFFAFLPAGKIFGFHWTISTVRTLFDSERLNELYNRTYITYALNDTIAVGPQVESVTGFGDGGGLWAFNLGGRLNINYGANNTLGLYIGYETKKDEGETGLTGRMNFTRTW